MANAQHLALLQQGVEVWNAWRANHHSYETLVDLVGVNFSGVNLSHANLSRANLTGADLSGANLSNANFKMANLGEVNFTGADLTGADLKMANLRMAILSGVQLSGANLTGAYLTLANLNEANLSAANLSGVNLRMAYLGEADLSGANLSEANLSGAILQRTQALNTNFNKAIFTGACLQDWRIDSDTNLYNVSCEYVYLKPNQQERCPSSGNFATGEFFMLFRMAPEPVDMIVHDEANTAQVYQIRDDLQPDTSQQNTIEVTSPEPRNSVPVKAIGGNFHSSKSPPKTLELTVVEGRNAVRVNAIGNERQLSATQQNLNEVVTEIQQLLEVGQVYPTTTPIEKLIVVLEAIRRIESNSSLKTRVINALSEVGPDAFRELIDTPLTNIFLASVEDWYSGH
jgi:uncharacterized protein YjbI with pentapeptide repeats